MISISAGWPSVLPGQCGTRLSNLAASPTPRKRSWSPRIERIGPARTRRAQPRTSTISKEAGHVGAHGSARASHRVDQTTTGGSVWTVTPPFVVCVPQGHGLLLSGMVSTAVLATKLFAPVRRPQLVARHRVAERLNLALDAGHRLTLVSAPAGFGKTTLLSPDPPMCF